jgi:hypothetical protein
MFNSVEAQVRRSLWRMTFWRIVTMLLLFPVRLFKAISDVFDDLSSATFNFEQDAARRYYSLTGVDLGLAVGEPDRYRTIRMSAGEEE